MKPLTAAQQQLLGILSEEEGWGLHQLTSYFNSKRTRVTMFTKPQMSALLQRMKAKGLVEHGFGTMGFSWFKRRNV